MDLSCVKSMNLLEAVQKNRLDEIQTRLRLGDNVDTAYTMGRTALHCAATNCNVETVATLLMYSPSVQMCDNNGYSALHMACSRSGASSLLIIEKLVAAGADINCVNMFGRTALHECVISNNVEGAKKLLESGANNEMLELLDSQVRSAWELALSRNNLEMIHILACQGTADLGIVGNGIKASASGPIPKKMTAKEEKEALTRRLAELEEDETKRLESKLSEKNKEVENIKEAARSEIVELEKKIEMLQFKQKKKISELGKEIDKLVTEICIRKIPEKNQDIVSCLECPVCLDVCKPPVQVWQCPEGHIICGSCKVRPELKICPQCRIVLAGQLSRNRAMEELARKTFNNKEEEEVKNETGTGGGWW